MSTGLALKLAALFTLVTGVFFNLNFFYARSEGGGTPLWLYTLYGLPGLYLANLLLYHGFRLAVKDGSPVWGAQVIYWSVEVLGTALFAFLWFREIPSLRTLLGMALVMAGATLTVWR